MPLMKVVLPLSAAEFYKNIFTIAAFDVYELNDFYNELLEVEELGPKNENFEDFGFESRYMLNNLGTMILFYIAYPLLILI